MALVVAAILVVLVGSVGVVVSPVTHEQNVRRLLKFRLTTRHSNRRSHCLAGGAHSLAAAHHAADILGGRNSLDCARPDNRNLWLGVDGHSHRRNGLEDGPT